MTTKRISPQAILFLKEALSVIFWKKEELHDFLKMSISSKSIIGAIDWTKTKRESVKELIEIMTNQPNLYESDLTDLILSVSNLENFDHLRFWDEDGSKTLKAKKAVSNLRSQTTGFLQRTKDEEDASRRKLDFEKRLSTNKSLQEDIYKLKTRFNTIATCRDLQKRGYDLEKFLYDLFLLYDLEPKGSFKNYGEQIDGSFTFQGTDYLLEAKWKRQVDRSDLATFCYKVETKFKTAVGLLVTIDGVTSEAISPDFKSIIVMDGVDIMTILEGRVTLPDLLFRKRRKAIETGKIYQNFSQL